jgi:hypothetical protein
LNWAFLQDLDESSGRPLNEDIVAWLKGAVLLQPGTRLLFRNETARADSFFGFWASFKDLNKSQASDQHNRNRNPRPATNP